MARYSYQARDGSGEAMTGVIQAASMEEAGALLRAEGKFIVKLAPAREVAEAPSAASLEAKAKRVKREEVISFAHQLAVMIDTGVPIVESLQCVADNAASPAFKVVIGDVAAHVQGGGDLSSALRKYPRVFPAIMISLIKASELSGTMGPMLERISAYLAKEQATYRKARNAMMYPTFMLVMAVGVTIFLLTFVLPRFAGIYETRGAALPAPTQFLLSTSALLVNHWVWWVVGVIVAVAGGMIFSRTPTGKRLIDYAKINLPVMGKLFRKLYITRATRTMGTMINSGVAVLDMIAIVKQVTQNAFYEDLWDEVDERLRQGSQLSEPLFASSLIPRSISQMIYSGERSGRLGKVLDKIAHYTEDEFDDAVKTTTQFIEPLMIGVMGSIIGFVAISLLLPIFSVSTVVASK
jgi:type IV pilus assembly protein PilC